MNEIKKYVDKVLNYEDLSEEEASRAFQIIMKGGATPVQISALLVALRMKGESIDEITAAAKVMRAKAEKFKAPEGSLDTCGTGGDASGSYNVSTAVAFVVAGCGVPVAKHGNKAISSKSGSADVLRKLGVEIEAKKEVMEEALEKVGICFMMAPLFHTAMRHVGDVRRDLGTRTIFNVLGPLSNPANAKYQLLGVYSDKLVKPIAEVLGRLGLERAWVVHGSDGMDELTLTGKSKVAELKDGKVKTFTVDPEKFGLELVEPEDLKGGNEVENARELKEVLMGRGKQAYRDIVILNAGAGLVVAGKAKDLKEGIKLAAESIDEGRANDKLMELVAITNE